jgi:hypothetical protein
VSIPSLADSGAQRGIDEMAGQIKTMLDRIIAERGKGDRVLGPLTKAKLILKGFDPDRFGPNTPDDPAIIAKIKQLARDLGVSL